MLYKFNLGFKCKCFLELRFKYKMSYRCLSCITQYIATVHARSTAPLSVLMQWYTKFMASDQTRNQINNNFILTHLLFFGSWEYILLIYLFTWASALRPHYLTWCVHASRGESDRNMRVHCCRLRVINYWGWGFVFCPFAYVGTVCILFRFKRILPVE